MSKLLPWSELPLRPRFIQDAALVPMDDGFLLDGLGSRRRIRTTLPRSVLWQFLALLDGARTMADIQTMLPQMDADDIHKVMHELCNARLVEDASGDSETISADHTLGFLRRLPKMHGDSVTGYERYRRLRGADIRIATHGTTAAHELLMQRILLEAGVQEVKTLDSEDSHLFMPDTSRNGQNALILSFTLGTEDGEWHRHLEERCCRAGLRWYRIVVDQDHVDLGPMFQGSRTGCFQCFETAQVRASAGHRQEQIPVAQTGTGIDIWASLSAIDVLYKISGVEPHSPPRLFRRYDRTTWQVRELRFPRHPRCPTCFRTRDEHPRHTPTEVTRFHTAFLYEECVDEQPATTLLEPPRQPIVSRPNRTTASAFSLFTLQPLPTGASIGDRDVLSILSNNRQGSSGSRCDLTRLATVLKMAAGIRFSHTRAEIKRCAPTAGNLGSVEVYVAARRVSGLKPGVYYYQAATHSLASLRWKIAKSVDYLVTALCNRDAELPDATIIFTGAFGRLAVKYGAFAFRLTNLDAGCAVSQSEMVAASLALRVKGISRWYPDHIEDELKLSFPYEQITAIVDLLPDFPAALAPHATVDESSFAARSQSAEPLCGVVTAEVLDRLCRESRLPPNATPVGHRLTAKSEHPLNRAVSPALRLSYGVDRSLPFDAALCARASVRCFAPTPLCSKEIGTILRYASHTTLTSFREDRWIQDCLTIRLFLTRAEGIPPGVYDYHASDNGLYWIAEQPSPSAMRELYISEKSADASAHFWIAGALGATCDRYGSWGYRQMVVAAGALAHRLSFAALGIGLAGYIVAGLKRKAANQYLDLDGYHLSPLVAFLCGVASANTR